jgi:hypothetical protein
MNQYGLYLCEEEIASTIGRFEKAKNNEDVPSIVENLDILSSLYSKIRDHYMAFYLDCKDMHREAPETEKALKKALGLKMITAERKYLKANHMIEDILKKQEKYGTDIPVD